MIKKFALFGVFLFLLLIAISFFRPVSLIDGIIWQPSGDYPVPEGHWHWIGADTLMVQWLVVDDLAFIPIDGITDHPDINRWRQQLDQPWARRQILGLAGRFDLEEARQQSQYLADQGQRIIGASPVFPDQWYAAVELSPDWGNTEDIRQYFSQLKRPLAVSVYGSFNKEPEEFAAWVERVVPDDVLILLQDEVGVGRQTPERAREVYDVLERRVGDGRLMMIMEAFQPTENGFDKASLVQLQRQVNHYRGLPVLVFSAQHLDTPRVVALRVLNVLR